MSLRDICNEVLSIIYSTLAEKNAAYGDSARNPMRVFSTSSATEQLLVRIDDKLSRIRRGGPSNEDAELDLLGYLIILRMGNMSFSDELIIARVALEEDVERILKSLDATAESRLVSSLSDHVAVQLDTCLAHRDTDAAALLVVRIALRMARQRGAVVR